MFAQREMRIEQPFNTSTEVVNRGCLKKAADVKPKTSVSNLSSRIDVVRSQLHLLKEQVHRERMLLYKEQQMAYLGSENTREQSEYTHSFMGQNKTINRFGTPSACNPYRVSTPTTFDFEDMSERPGITALNGPSRKHLEDIEMQCDKELMKLDDYLNNISRLKSYWMEASRSAQF